MAKKANYYIAKIVEATSIRDALRKEKTVEPYDVRRTTTLSDGVNVSAIGFASPEPID